MVHRLVLRTAALLWVLLLLLGGCRSAATMTEAPAATVASPVPSHDGMGEVAAQQTEAAVAPTMTSTALALTIPPATAAPTEAPTPAPTPAPTATPEPTPDGLCGGRYPNKFTETPVFTDTTYRSRDLSVFLSKVYDESSFSSFVTYFVADIYVQDITLLQTASAGADFTRRQAGSVKKMAQDHDALLAASGDYYAHSMQGLIIRNGVSYNDRPTTRFESCVLFRDGPMAFYAPDELDIPELLAAGAWQGWTFGPSLLSEDGQPLAKAPSAYGAVSDKNPRCMLGYYEPGHYCLVVADGRQHSRRYSDGLTLLELSQLAYDLGCTKAYNLDGGLSAQLFWQDEIYNHPPGGGRSISDILYFAVPEIP